MQVLGCPKTPASKPYIASLLKVLAGLPLGGCSQETVKRLRSLAGALAALFCLIFSVVLLQLCRMRGMCPQGWQGTCCKQKGNRRLSGLAGDSVGTSCTACAFWVPLTCTGCVLMAPAPAERCSCS